MSVLELTVVVVVAAAVLVVAVAVEALLVDAALLIETCSHAPIPLGFVGILLEHLYIVHLYPTYSTFDIQGLAIPLNISWMFVDSNHPRDRIPCV